MEERAPLLPTGQLDIRVGRIVEVEKHPDADRWAARCVSYSAARLNLAICLPEGAVPAESVGACRAPKIRRLVGRPPAPSAFTVKHV